MEKYCIYKYKAFRSEAVIDLLIDIAEKEPDSLLSYSMLGTGQDPVDVNGLCFYIMVPKSEIGKWQEAIDAADWSDTDTYELEPEPWRFALKKYILEDLIKLKSVFSSIVSVKAGLQSRYTGDRAVEEAKKAVDGNTVWLVPDGPHWLTAVQDFHVDEDEDTFSQLDGFVIVIDGKPYLAVEDQADGYRSYAVLRDVDIDKMGIKITNRFEPQKVYAVSCREKEEGDWVNKDAEVFRLKNQYGQTVLEISTDYSEDYYPVGIVSYHPENLPCNAKQLPN